MTGVGCHEFRDHAPELALGLLAGDERGAAIDHLAVCGSCRAHLEGLVHVADDLLMLAPPVEPDIGFESRLIARLAAEGAFSAPAAPVQPTGNAEHPGAAPPLQAAGAGATTAPAAALPLGAEANLPTSVAPVARAAPETPLSPPPSGSPRPAAEPVTPVSSVTAAPPATAVSPIAPVTPTGPTGSIFPLGAVAAIGPEPTVTPGTRDTPVGPVAEAASLAVVTPLGGQARSGRRRSRLVVTGIAALAAAAFAIGAAAAGLRAGRDSGRADALRSEVSSVNQLGARAVIVRADGGKSTCQLVAFPSDGSHPAWVAIHLDEPGEPPGSYLVYAEPADGGPAVLVGSIPVVGGQGSLTAAIPAGIGPVHGVRIIDMAPTVKYRATFAPI